MSSKEPTLGYLIEQLGHCEAGWVRAKNLRPKTTASFRVEVVQSAVQQMAFSESVRVETDQLFAALQSLPGFDRLQVYCEAKWGEGVTMKNAMRIRGMIGMSLRSLDKASAMTLEAAADYIVQPQHPAVVELATINQATPQNERAAAMSQFNWLHLTDLHWGQTGQKHLWPEIREQFFDDLKELRAKCGPWQAVLFSGDFVQQGKAAEFKQLEKEVLGPLWATLNKLDSGNAVLLAVPGNHDLVRPVLKEAGQLASALRWLLKPEHFNEVADEVFENRKSHERRVIDNAFANYRAWWKKKPHRGDHLLQDSDFPGDFSTTFEVDGGFRVGVVGLNSTFLQLAGGDYQRKLALDLRQFHAACKSEGGPQDGPAWAKQHDVCLLMTHQGLDWLDDASKKEGYSHINPAGRFAVHLFGHMHEEIIRGESSRGGEMRRFWQGNSLFSKERYEGQKEDERRHGYAAGSLSFHGDHAMLRRWPRKAVTDTANGWRFIPDVEGGILEDDGGTRPDPIRLGRGKTSSLDTGPAPTIESIEQTTERVLGSYHRTVQQAWDERWAEVISNDAADE